MSCIVKTPCTKQGTERYARLERHQISVMKCKNTMRTFILALLLALLASCTSREERLLQETLDFARDNRGELEAVLRHYRKRTYPFCYNNDFSYPNLGGEYLLRHPVGACREETDFMTYLLRTVGVPVATDRYLCSPDAFLGHSWNVFRDTTGRFIPTELLRTGVSRKWTNRRRKGKVYRWEDGRQQFCYRLQE